MACGFRYYFTPLTGVLFNFPSLYWCTIGHEGVFSLSRWSGQLPTEFHVNRRTWVLIPWCLVRCRVRAFHPLWSAVPSASAIREICNTTAGLSPRPDESRDPDAATPTGLHSIGLGSSRFARRYYGIRCTLSLPPGTEMFQFPGFGFRRLTAPDSAP